MQALLTPIKEFAEYENIVKTMAKREGAVALSGLVDSCKLHLVYGLAQDYRVRLIVTYNDLRAREIYEEYKFYDRNVILFPAKDFIFFQADLHGNQLTKERVKALRRIVEGKPVTLVTTFAALMAPQVLWDLDTDFIELDKNGVVRESAIASKLVEMGYEKTAQVDSPGQFSIRGGIVDVFDLTEENPIRIELWGDEIESIRSFDVLSQRSIEQLESVTIYPATEFVLSKAQIDKGLVKIQAEADATEKKFREAFLTEEAYRIKSQTKELVEELTELFGKVNIESYIKYFYEDTKSLASLLMSLEQEKPTAKTVFFLEEPGHIREQGDAVELEFRESMEQRAKKGYILPGQMDLLYSTEQVAAALSKARVVTLSALAHKDNLVPVALRVDVESRNAMSYNKSFEILVKDLKNYAKKGYRVLLLSGSRTRAQRLAEDLRYNEVSAVFSENPQREVIQGEVLTAYGHVGRGFEYPLLKFVVLAETDIFGVEKKKKKRSMSPYKGTKISSFDDLKVGDYVVHEHYGLGVYQGIEKVTVDHVVKDYMKISYRGGGNLYVLATGLDAIQKYASADAEKVPKLNKLGSKEWETTKTKVRTAVAGVAKELVELYALRGQAEGFQYGPDTVWQKEFEEMFPFEETEDQLAAIADTKADMESGKIMDRLICGDVGYGKTEIAIRAAFKAVQEGKQVAYLVPTTILAQQHYNTFTQRMKDFPVSIELLSRFRSAGEVKKAVAGLKKGSVDIVIGTHRLLSADVEFKDLGLLIIDEEQRFGVSHKEKIKRLKENVNVLTLTATPIPRTLHMSLIGIRDMSVLEQAPEDRLPIQTYVCEYNEEMVREAIARELARGGQVYYVYNRVNRIADVAAALQQMMPDINVAYAHGQMKEQELEQIMMDFINGDIDVLVSTTIIETGLDISNANTMIIHDSDNMGLSQLYQLRGRVGRSNRTAYAFLMYKRDKMLREVAEKRLAAIKEFTDLGSGFKIAMRDLEIRGAGNLLGMRQHGHMEAVGYDLYCKMLNEAVQNLKGVPGKMADFPTVIELMADAFIPASYILNEEQKLDIYKRIADLENEADKEDMRDELLDRFGEIPVSVENLLRIALIRVKAHSLGITEVKGRNERIAFHMLQTAPIKGEAIPDFLRKYQGKMNFTAYGNNPVLTYKYQSTGLVETDEIQLLELTEKILSDMEENILQKP